MARKPPEERKLHNSRRGGSRERKVIRCLRLTAFDPRRREAPMLGGGWVATRTPASKGEGGFDVIALRDEETLDEDVRKLVPKGRILIQIKATASGPFDDFGPEDRRVLLAAAAQAGAVALLVHWPYSGKHDSCRLYWPDEWPEAKRARRAAGLG